MPCQKGAGAEEDGVGRVAELFEQDVAGRRTLQQERIGQLAEQAVVQFTHTGVAGEKAEGAAAGDFQHAADLFRGLRDEVGVAGVGHGRRQVEQRLFCVVEVAGDDELFGERDAEALLQVREAGGAVLAGHGERGGGEDDRAEALKERVGEELGDVDGGGLEVGGEGLVDGGGSCGWACRSLHCGAALLRSR